MTSFVGGGTLEQWSRLSKYLSAENNPLLKPVEASSFSYLDRDVSTRARSYPYCGTNPTEGSGWATSIENEVTVNCPILSKFVSYNLGQEDRRVPTQLTPGSGDPSGVITIPLVSPGFDWRNKSPVRYMPIDFEEIYFLLAVWMAQAKEMAARQGNLDAASPLPFTMQDFRIALRQSLMGGFGTSCATQFQGPIQYNQNGNTFVPFISAGNCHANRKWTRLFRIPELISEALSSLKLRTLKGLTGKSVINEMIFIPVLGLWNQDEPAVIQMDLGGEAPVPLFTPDPTQSSISLIDGYSGNTPYNINNPYYQNVIEDWNTNVELVSSYVSATSPMFKDSGAVGLPLLFNSEVNSNQVNNTYADIIAKKLDHAEKIGTYKRSKSFKTPSPPVVHRTLDDHLIKNMEVIKIGSDKNVQYVPPATIPQLNTPGFFSLVPSMPASLVNLIQSLVLPSFRFNLEPPGDILNSNIVMTHTRQLTYYMGDSLAYQGTQSVMAKLVRLAALCVTGVGKEYSDEYTRIFAALTDHGKAGMIASFLAGIAKTIIPGIDGVADTLAAVVPF
jgi:hypothetical protein